MPVATRKQDNHAAELSGGDGGRLQDYLNRVSPEVVAVTYWFTPPAKPQRQTVTIRFTGHRVDVTGKAGPGDQFSRDITVSDILGGSGPVSVTAKIAEVNPGEWQVSAKMLPGSRRDDRSRGQRKAPPAAPQPVYRAAWSWRRWRLSKAEPEPVHTCSAAMAPAPGLLFGSWAVLAILGILVALVVQRAVISRLDLGLSAVLPISLAAVVAGVIGAKAWYMVLHRGTGRRDGWCIQGLVVGIAIVAPLLLAATGNSIGDYFDATAPGLLIGMAIGRLGCFFAGCCCGRPTASRWGVWSSDQQPVGVRRIPTQLVESGFTFAVGLATLAAVLQWRPARGAWFVAGLAAYTIGRQGILRWRAERKSPRAGLVTACVATALLLADLGLVAAGVL